MKKIQNVKCKSKCGSSQFKRLLVISIESQSMASEIRRIFIQAELFIHLEIVQYEKDCVVNPMLHLLGAWWRSGYQINTTQI